ncbi:MAG: isoaspartyl peptidase/L-asparaginase [Myxococcales bacterium]|nr:isoaspartyl peptidase/L-asparaginase [Polyangiaceae bacterium]MDW8250320.1 isoaspartyl peptidase/L-asparaginase [Myxococcales bacterium]
MSVRFSWCGGEVGAWSILVHGGAGDLPPERREAHAAGCREAARLGAEILAAGGSALDAVQAAVTFLEDDPRYNAGTGASLDERGELSLDAAVMDGATLAVGGVCALPPFRNPIAIAREVLRDGRHVLYAGEGAARFAEERGFFRADPATMITETARARLEETRRGQDGNWADGTVGAVARDISGHLAAATSTGGTVGKRYGRVGDTPIPGAGTYADDLAAAASGTGYGEGYLRTGICLRACLWIQEGKTPQEAAETAIRMLWKRAQARGGILLVAPDGRLALARSTETMSWGACWASLEHLTAGS